MRKTVAGCWLNERGPINHGANRGLWESIVMFTGIHPKYRKLALKCDTGIIKNKYKTYQKGKHHLCLQL